MQAFNEASANVETAAVAADELCRSISEISRQLTQTSSVVGLATKEARDTDSEIAGLADGAQKIGDVVKLIRNMPGRRICSRLTPPSRPPVPARQAKGLPWSPPR